MHTGVIAGPDLKIRPTYAGPGAGSKDPAYIRRSYATHQTYVGRIFRCGPVKRSGDCFRIELEGSRHRPARESRNAAIS
jgi:hypothetical protein